MKATKLPSGNYRVNAFLGYDDKGRQIRRSFTSHDAKHAIALATDYIDKHRIAVDNASLLVIMRKFLKDREPFLSPNTYEDYESKYRTLKTYYPDFCAKHIYSVTDKDLRDLIANMSRVQKPHHRLNKAPKALSQKTIKNYIGFLSGVFSYANCPLPPYELPEEKVPQIYVPTDDEIKILIDAVKDTDMYIPVLLAAFGPLRRGEICALEYPRDFSGDVVHVRESVAKKSGRYVKKAPKTLQSDRYIKLPSWIIEAVKEEGYVTRLQPGTITARFPHILRRAGLPQFRFHDLRHYCVSTLHAQNVPDAYIMRRGGWSTDTVLKRVYRHTLADQDAIQTDRALAHFDSIFF